MELKFYCFDLDDNLLHMQTCLIADVLTDGKWVRRAVTSDEHRQLRKQPEIYQIPEPDIAFSNFRDYGARGINALIEDAKEAIVNGWFAPSWDAFIQCMINGNLLAIITARGHNSSTLRLFVDYVINNVLTKEQKSLMDKNCEKYDGKYLDHCKFYGVTGEEFINLMKLDFDPDHDVETAKELAIKHFIDDIEQHITDDITCVKVGFSDDDMANYEHIHDVFLNLSKDSHINFYVYNTNNRNIKGGIKKKIEKV